MKIIIDGQTVNVTLQSEKTLGEVLVQFGAWLERGGLEVREVTIDGRKTGASGMEKIFTEPLAGVNILELKTTPAAALVVEALAAAQAAQKEKFSYEEWNARYEAKLLRDKEPALASKIESALKDNVLFDLSGVIKERYAEINDPCEVFCSLENEVASMEERLQNYALLRQTGKDVEAHVSIEEFAGLFTKIVRLLPLLRFSGVEPESLELADNFFSEYNGILLEFFNASETSDTVMAGDLAEYEIAPRLKELFSAVKKDIENRV